MKWCLLLSDSYTILASIMVRECVFQFTWKAMRPGFLRKISSNLWRSNIGKKGKKEPLTLMAVKWLSSTNHFWKLSYADDLIILFTRNCLLPHEALLVWQSVLYMLLLAPPQSESQRDKTQ